MAPVSRSGVGKSWPLAEVLKYWYYFGADGKMTKGAQNINSKDYYFFEMCIRDR